MGEASKTSADREVIDVVGKSRRVQYEPMSLFSSARAVAGITGLAVTGALLTMAPAAPLALAAEPTSVVRSTAVDHGRAGSQSVNGIIMRDGGLCDPIRHMGC